MEENQFKPWIMYLIVIFILSVVGAIGYDNIHTGKVHNKIGEKFCPESNMTFYYWHDSYIECRVLDNETGIYSTETYMVNWTVMEKIYQEKG